MTPMLTATPTGFLRHGEPHLVISGAVHYFRVHPDLWRDRLRRLVAMGCNTVETYVAWNLHQPAPDQVDFSGMADLGRFLDIADEEGLDAIVRPGPYICAEWESGGFPGWLLRDRDMRLRTRDPRFLEPLDAWFDQLIPVIAKRQAGRGGNVVMVQVENEYGSFGDDAAYLEHLRDGLIARGINELLVTSDGPGRMWLSGGRVDGVLATVNFGSRTREVIEMAQQELPDQPLMCMEFWNGWFDHWGEEHHRRDAASAAEELETMLSHGMSVNFYMAHGGTNFGLTAGANHGDGYEPTTTSYDYDAPIAEDGTLTEKFHAFREVISRFHELPPLAEHLETLGIAAEPVTLPETPVRIERTTALRESDRFTRRGTEHPMPPSFESIGLERGLQLLRRDIEITRSEHEGRPAIAPLKLYGLADRAWLYVDGLYAGPAQRGEDPAVLDFSALTDRLLPEGTERRTVRIELLVENLARVNFGPYLADEKGILRGVWQIVRFLNGWEVDAWPLEEMGEELAALVAEGAPLGTDGGAGGEALDPVLHLPVLVSCSFDAETPSDAYLDVSDAGHGVAWANGFCLGRYWDVGPQQSLYVPAPLLREGRNEVLLLDLERIPHELALSPRPIFGPSAHAV